MTRRLLISFSGGETSAYMTRLLLTELRHSWDEVVVVFANTGQENEQTLEFVNKCDQAFGFNTVWVEAVVNPDSGKGTSFRIVDFQTASRTGGPFEDVIRKYGIPNNKFPHCTRELKRKPIEAYMKFLGWGATGRYDTAIGIRADEPNRRSPEQQRRRLVYPLLDSHPIDKQGVNAFWQSQDFRLELCGYQGNCKWCWKKSMRKLLTIAAESPQAFDFPRRMESTYQLVGPEFKKVDVPGYQRVFFRNNLSATDILNLAELSEFDRAEDDANFLDGGDASDGCSESCEVNFD